MSDEWTVDIFVEDRAHEHFVRGLVIRIAEEEAKPIVLQVRSARGGHGRVVSEYENYQMLVGKGALATPHLLVVTIDANCTAYSAKRDEVLEATEDRYHDILVVGCPDPHVERWYLADIPSFQRVVGVSPSFQRRKCQRDYYKSVLANAVRDAGHPSTLGGIEFAEELARDMDLYSAGRQDRSLGAFTDDLRNAMRRP